MVFCVESSYLVIYFGLYIILRSICFIFIILCTFGDSNENILNLKYSETFLSEIPISERLLKFLNFFSFFLQVKVT